MRLGTISRATLVAVLFTAIPLSSATGVASTVTPAPSANQATRLTNLKTRGTAEIDRRLTNLNAAITKLNGSTKLAQNDKNVLVTQVTDEVTALTTLRAKL